MKINQLMPGIFIDRDDVINKCPAGIPGDPAGYITKWDQFEFYPDVDLAFALMYTMPYKVFVVSNQSGISRENIECTEQSIHEIFMKMMGALKEAVTEKIKLAPLVSCYGYRRPTVLAKMATTVDIISGGRLIFGIGAGWHEAEFKGYMGKFPSVSRRL